MLKLKLDRPLAVFDIESTGTSPRADRIVELAMVKILPDGKRQNHVWRVHPGIPIPPESTKIHGISDADVAGCPTFQAIAGEIQEAFLNCDLCGYNILRFDIPMLIEEFARAGFIFDVENRRVIDPQRIYHRRVPRDLTAALSFYCGEMHLNAHGAEGDVLATIRVLEGQFEKYSDLPTDMDELAEYCNPREPGWVDQTGRLKWADGEIVINFGKQKGKSLKKLVEEDPGFIKWMIKSDFPRDTRNIVENATLGKWPSPPDNA